MHEILLDNRQVDEARASYASDWEYLTDELKRLDLLIRLGLLREQHDEPANLLDQFRGLVLAEEEIVRLLADSARPPCDDAPIDHEHREQQELVKALSRLEDHMQQRRAASTRDAVSLSLPVVAQLFHLTRFEEMVEIGNRKVLTRVTTAPFLNRTKF